MTHAYRLLYGDSLTTGAPLNNQAYSAIDTARLAVERHQYDGADAQLKIFDAIYKP